MCMLRLLLWTHVTVSYNIACSYSSKKQHGVVHFFSLFVKFIRKMLYNCIRSILKNCFILFFSRRSQLEDVLFYNNRYRGNDYCNINSMHMQDVYAATPLEYSQAENLGDDISYRKTHFQSITCLGFRIVKKLH